MACLTLSPEWAPVVSGLGGTALGGMIGFATSLALARGTEQRERRSMLAGKFEEIVEAILVSRRAGAMLTMIWEDVLLHDGKLSEPDIAPPHDRIITLVDIYAPTLASFHGKVYEAAEKRDLIQTELRTGIPEKAAEREAVWGRFSAASAELDAAFETLREGVVRLAQAQLRLAKT